MIEDYIAKIRRVIGEDDYGTPQEDFIELTCSIGPSFNKNNLVYDLTIYSKYPLYDNDEIIEVRHNNQTQDIVEFYIDKKFRINNVSHLPDLRLAYYKGVLNGKKS